MTGKTHRVGGMLCVLGGFSYLEYKGLLLSDVSPVLQLAVMYPFALYGSTFSDLDQGENSIPSRDIVSLAINKVLHLPGLLFDATGEKVGFLDVLDAKHRSWQTHSDLFLGLICYGVYKLLTGVKVNQLEYAIMMLMSVGFLLGVISHLLLDMLNPEGIWCVVLVIVGRVGSGFSRKAKKIPRKISFVPKTKYFRTGGVWEDIVRRVLWVLCIILFVRVIYVLLPYRVVLSFRF